MTQQTSSKRHYVNIDNLEDAAREFIKQAVKLDDSLTGFEMSIDVGDNVFKIKVVKE